MAAARKSATRLTKVVDECAAIRCAVGDGLLREEVWQDAAGKLARYNLAFVNHHLCPRDHGRVLGYDTAHGFLHRHFAGKVEALEPASYSEILERFLAEVENLRQQTKL